MRVYSSFEAAAEIRNAVVTTGTFDGVHIGHKTILNRLNKLAREVDGESVLITFHPHPRLVLYPESAGKDLKLINSQEEKIELLRKAGLGNLIVIEFTREFSQTTSEEFIARYLHGNLRAKVVVVGHNHHFGFNQKGDYRQLWDMRGKYGFEAEEIPMQEVQNEIVSSTKIREAITEGYIQRANAYLDHYYIIIGVAASSEDDLYGSGIPVTNIGLTEVTKLTPASGIYAVTVAGDAFYSRAMVIVDNGKDLANRVKVHLFEYDKTIPAKKLTLFFHKKIRTIGEITAPANPASGIRAALAEIYELIF
ncbi:MAG: adenylyltransferase/cytidyltransferase family protein [Bacteroidales bacterium]|nr:adenylyltransferase/cytidyltransferase family protein [Bacteroidales bacterium]